MTVWANVIKADSPTRIELQFKYFGKNDTQVLFLPKCYAEPYWTKMRVYAKTFNNILQNGQTASIILMNKNA